MPVLFLSSLQLYTTGSSLFGVISNNLKISLDRLLSSSMSTYKSFPKSGGKGSACRRLFGPIDCEQLRAEYQNALNRELEDAACRWGFDFLTDTPLEGGDFIWEGILETKVPALYHSCTHPPKIGVNGKENVPRTPERNISLPLGLEQTPEKNQTGKMKRKQTSITDFYKSKRRVVATSRKSGQ